MGWNKAENSLNIFDLIDQVCADFRAQWKDGTRPQIDKFLDSVAEDARETLFKNLLQLEVRYRRRAQETPSSSEYLQRFPSFGGAIRREFDESTMMTMEVNHSTSIHREQDLTVSVALPNAIRIGDYELLGELGRGGMGVVYRARHLRQGNIVALKTLPTGGDQHEVNAERLHRFRQEFRTLSEINHPNLVGMQTLEVDGTQWFFTMDLIDGTDFLSYVRPSECVDFERLTSAAKQFANGIVSLHDQRILHRDLKPSNVLVSTDGEVFILDFGLIAELESTQEVSATVSTNQFVGTPKYAAPEQAFGQRTPASDWYAFGAMLYEAMVGKPPFQGTPTELIIKKQSEDAPKLSGDIGASIELVELVNRLLNREPESRPVASEICEVIGVGDGDLSHSTGDQSHGGSQSTSDLVLIGREEQLAQLSEAYVQLVGEQKSSVVFVKGKSGEGKTSLIDNFLKSTRQDRETVVLSGRCYDRESVPFKAVDCIVNALVAFLRTVPEQKVISWLPDDVQMLARLFPILRRVDAIGEGLSDKLAAVEDQQVRYRAFYALRELLSNIGQGMSLVIFIDDLQWGDADSAEVIFELLSAQNASALLFVGAYRSDEAKDSPFLQEWKRVSSERESSLMQRDVSVAPLTENQCMELLGIRLGVSIDELRHQVGELIENAQGNPYFLEQLSEGFSPLNNEYKLVSLSEVVEEKLVRLPDEALKLLHVIAVAGRSVSFDEASKVAGCSSQAASTLTHMRSERLVRLIGVSEHPQIDTFHDKIRETVLSSMEDSLRTGIHIAFGEHLQDQESTSIAMMMEYLDADPGLRASAPEVSERVYDLAYHFHAAGDPRGFAYQLMAGELSYRAFASDEALEFLRRAESTIPRDVSAMVRFRLYERLGTCLSRTRQFEEADKAFQVAIDTAPTELSSALAHSGRGFVSQSLCDFDGAMESFDSALRAIHAKRPQRWMAFIRMVPMSLSLLVTTSRWRRRKPDAETSRSELEQQVYLRMVFFAFDLETGFFDYPYTLIRIANLSTRVSEPSKYAAGLGMFGSHLAMNGLCRLGERFLNRAKRTVGEIDDFEEFVWVNGPSAVLHQNARQLELAKKEFSESIPACIRAGMFAQGIVLIHLSRHLYALIGTAREEYDVAAKGLSLAQEVGDIRGQCWSNYDGASALARAGELAPAVKGIQRAHELIGDSSWGATRSVLMGAEGYVLLQASEYERARFALQESWRSAKRLKSFFEYTLISVPLLIQSMIGPEWNTRPDRDSIRPLKRLGRLARLVALFYPNLESPSYRAVGRLHASMGRRKRAIRAFQRAIKSASELGSVCDQARALLDLASIEEEASIENRTKAIELLKEMGSVIPRAEAWQLADTFDAQVVAEDFDLDEWEAKNGRVSPTSLNEGPK